MGSLARSLGAIGVLVSGSATEAINRVVADLTGFPNLIKIPLWLSATGLLLAVAMGTLGSAVAGWRVGRLSPLAHLQR